MFYVGNVYRMVVCFGVCVSCVWCVFGIVSFVGLYWCWFGLVCGLDVFVVFLCLFGCVWLVVVVRVWGGRLVEV